jgi:hypothetical protein
MAIGYLDMTFCPFWEDCNKGMSCGRKLTQDVRDRAEAWWGQRLPCPAPIGQFSEKPDCWEQK